jgi:hypothetical protein
VRTEHAARDEQERQLRELGRALRPIIDPERWDELDDRERAAAIEAAVVLAADRMGASAVPVVWTNDPERRGFEETGELEFPRSDLAKLSAEDAVGLVGHEVRHVWQWDVIEGRIDPPGGDRERKQFVDAYRAYDSENAFKYRHNELELDANDRAAYVVEGFLEPDTP